MSEFESVWSNIVKYAGETFHQIRGGEFTYEIEHGQVRPNQTNRVIPRSNFEEAYQLMPLAGTVQIQHLQGPSYIYAILTDNRISG